MLVKLKLITSNALKYLRSWKDTVTNLRWRKVINVSGCCVFCRSRATPDLAVCQHPVLLPKLYRHSNVRRVLNDARFVSSGSTVISALGNSRSTCFICDFLMGLHQQTGSRLWCLMASARSAQAAGLIGLHIALH